MSVCSLYEGGRLPTPPGERTATLIIREGGDGSPAVRLQTASEKPSTYTEKSERGDCFRPCRVFLLSFIGGSDAHGQN